MTWNSETFAQNPNANAIRWGTLYNFRFDSNSPPQTTNATVGFLKTGTPVTVQIQSPGSVAAPTGSITGRVLSPGGLGLRNTLVALTDANGVRRTARTSSFGVYSFENIPTDGTYILGVSSKQYRFPARNIVVSGNLSDVDFIGLE